MHPAPVGVVVPPLIATALEGAQAEALGGSKQPCARWWAGIGHAYRVLHHSGERMADRRSRLKRWADQVRSQPRSASDPEVFDPESIDRTVAATDRWIGPDRYLDTVVTGWEHLPDTPALLVANHSGGTTVPDVWCLLTAWYQHFGSDRPLFTLGHELLFATDATTRFFTRRGVLRASHGSAEKVIEAGGDLLVMPGGERDVWRPWKQRWKVQFVGRTGYARLAMQHGLPIVPVAGAGAHHTLMVLSDGHRLAKALGLPSVARAEVLPLYLSVPWGLSFGPWPHLPVPHRMRFRIGPKIVPHGEPDDPEAVARLDAAVRAALQLELDAIRERWPESRRSVRRMMRHVLRPTPPSTDDG